MVFNYISNISCHFLKIAEIWGYPVAFCKLTHWPLGDLNVILMWFNFALLIGIFQSSYVYVLRWMPLDLTDDKSTLVQVMAWCHQATSHYLNQCWPRSPMPYGITMPQWVKTLIPDESGCCSSPSILKCIFCNDFLQFSLKFHWNIHWNIHFYNIIKSQCFRWWLGAISK